MSYTPTRIMVPLQPKGISQALGQLASKRGEHPRETARELIRQGLERAGELCPQCDQPLVEDPHRPGARYCNHCQEPVFYAPEGIHNP